jgi:hypothetical protein
MTHMTESLLEHDIPFVPHAYGLCYMLRSNNYPARLSGVGARPIVGCHTTPIRMRRWERQTTTDGRRRGLGCCMDIYAIHQHGQACADIQY